MLKTNPDDFIGKRYGELTVVSCLGYDDSRVLQFMTKCSCGRLRRTRVSVLKRGTITSCNKCNGKRRRLAFGQATLNQLLTDYKVRSKKKNLEFSLSPKEFFLLVQQNCFYCGGEPIYKLRDKDNFGGVKCHGIDRRNNVLGYTVENSVSCCKICNTMKMDLIFEDFKDQVERIHLKFSQEG